MKRLIVESPLINYLNILFRVLWPSNSISGEVGVLMVDFIQIFNSFAYPDNEIINLVLMEASSLLRSTLYFMTKFMKRFIIKQIEVGPSLETRRILVDWFFVLEEFGEKRRRIVDFLCNNLLNMIDLLLIRWFYFFAGVHCRVICLLQLIVIIIGIDDREFLLEFIFGLWSTHSNINQIIAWIYKYMMILHSISDPNSAILFGR